MDFFEALWKDFYDIAGEEIQLGTNSITTLNIIVWSLFIGFMIAIGVTLYNKIVLGTIVRGLIDRQAFCEDDALTAKAIGCNNIFIRFALRRGGSFRRIVRMTGDTETEQIKGDFSTAKFYIPEENVHRAEMIYGKAGASVFSVLLSVLAFLAVAFVSFIVIPDLIQMLVNFLESLAPESNIL